MKPKGAIETMGLIRRYGIATPKSCKEKRGQIMYNALKSSIFSEFSIDVSDVTVH